MKRWNNGLIRNDTRGSIVVEATILLPIIIMTFAGLVLLAMYMPASAQLQRATQYVATGIATARSDGSVGFDVDGYSWQGGDTEFENVYASMFSSSIGSNDARQIVVDYFDSGFVASDGELEVIVGVNNYIIYKEVYVTATKSIESPVNLSFVGFPETINLTDTSTAVVVNGDEFVRNMDLAADFIEYLEKRTGVDLSVAMSRIQDVLNFLSG